MRQCFCQTLSQGQSIRLSQSQRLALRQQQLSLRLALISELRGEEYKQKASCPCCPHVMTPVEIIGGFNQDPNDFTTRCPKCGHRFEPKVVCSGDGWSIELPFYCGVQSLAQMTDKHHLSPDQLSREWPAIYRSAIVHYGSIRNAFKTAGINYTFDEVVEWKNKVAPFLGRLPDTIIAGCTGMSVSTIRAFRKKLGISRYATQEALDEIED